jgi:hypothetical protein
MQVAGMGKSGYDWGMDDNTFECPNCGASVYPEMTRCPQCGQSMYPETDEVAEARMAQAEPAGWGAALGALLIGWMAAAGIALIVNFIVASFVSPPMLGMAGKVILLLAGPLGALAGSVLCGGMSKRRPLLLGSLVGVLTLPVLGLLATHWVQVTVAFVFSPWALAAGVLTLLGGVGGGWLSARTSADSKWRERWKVRGWEDLLYQDLLRKTRFNGPAADRLIEYERKRDPQASRLTLIQNAIERLERDNR